MIYRLLLKIISIICSLFKKKYKKIDADICRPMYVFKLPNDVNNKIQEFISLPLITETRHLHSYNIMIYQKKMCEEKLSDNLKYWYITDFNPYNNLNYKERINEFNNYYYKHQYNFTSHEDAYILLSNLKLKNINFHPLNNCFIELFLAKKI